MPKPTRQYTLRNIPDQVDRELRRRAKHSGKSFNQIAVEALACGAGAGTLAKRDLSFLVGSLSAAEAARLEKEFSAQRRVDPELWR
jgi:plasmid stability protein